MSKKMTPEIRFKGFTQDWEQRKLGELATFSKGTGYTKGDLVKKGTPIILYGRLYTKYQTVINQVDTFVDIKKKSVVSEGDEVIVPSSGESSEDISRASVVENSGILLGGDLNIIRTNSDINSIFLALAISNGKQQKELSKRAQGKSIVHLHNSDLKNVKLIYPTVEEQIKIGNLFKQIDYTIALHQRKLMTLGLLKKSFLRLTFPQKDEKVPRLRFANFSLNWEQHKLISIAEIYNNLRRPVTASDRVFGTTPYYGANGIQDYVDGHTHNGEYVLIAEDGANDLINYPVNYVKGKIWVNNHAHVVSGNKKELDNLFLTSRIKSMNISPWLVGGSRAKLNSNILKKILITIPNFNEQQKVGSFFKQLDDTIVLHHDRVEKLNQLKEVYLQKLFV